MPTEYARTVRQSRGCESPFVGLLVTFIGHGPHLLVGSLDKPLNLVADEVTVIERFEIAIFKHFHCEV